MTKLNYIIKHLTRITTAFILLGLLIVSSCKDDGGEKTVQVATVAFATSAQTVSENGSAVTVTLSLDKAAGKDGTITIGLAGTAEYTTDYTTNPAGTTGTITVSITEGQTAAQFTISPVNNALLQEVDKTVELSLIDASDAFEIGTVDLNTVTIIDDEGPTQANFSAASSSTSEDVTAGIDVTINLSSAAPGTGTVTVTYTSLTAVYTTNFTIEPAATTNQIVVPVATSATSVSFKVKPVDDANVNAAREIVFTIASADGAVVPGSAITEHTVTISDNETPSTATFTNTSGSIEEGVSAGITIPVTLDPQTNGSGTIAVTLTSPSAVYGTDYTTEPAAVAGVVTVNVAASATSASFKVIPIDNGAVAADKTLTLTMTSATGVVVLGSSNLVFTLTVEDDDAITTIADVRAMYSGTANITSSLRIQGIVTSSNPQVNTNNIWVQDATGGIVVRFVGPNNNTIVRGDEVNVQLNGGQFFEFNGLLQIQNVPNANATVVDQGNTLPTPEAITVAQLNTNNYEGKLVSVSGLAFVDADGTATMSGTRSVSNGTATTNVRTETGAPHASSVMPLGFGTITGLAGENGGAAQIIPVVFADDVFASNAVGTIGVTQAITDFGSVNNGASSTSQSYTVQGTTLNNDIVITASSGFKISTDDATFTSSVTIAAINANTSNTIYVRFTPTSGTNQAINGTITHKSLGAAPQSFAVSGTESGNAASDLLLLENFNYTAGELTTVATGVWTVNSGGGTNNIPVVAGALTLTDYPSSGVGNSITLTTTGQDAYRDFTGASATTGDVYTAFLMNVTSAQATGDYFFAMLPAANTSNYTGRTFIKSSGTGFVIGISKGSVGANETLTYGTTEFSFNTTYMVVIKYSFVAGTTNDTASIYVISGSAPATEPGVASASSNVNTNADQANLGRVGVRQGTAANAPAMKISGIRVAPTWADLFD